MRHWEFPSRELPQFPALRESSRLLERGVITGPVPHQDNVIVIVDNAGHCWPSAKVYDADSRSLPRNGATHCGEAIHYAAGEPGFFFCRSNSFMKAASRAATYAL